MAEQFHNFSAKRRHSITLNANIPGVDKTREFLAKLSGEMDEFNYKMIKLMERMMSRDMLKSDLYAKKKQKVQLTLQNDLIPIIKKARGLIKKRFYEIYDKLEFYLENEKLDEIENYGIKEKMDFGDFEGDVLKAKKTVKFRPLDFDEVETNWLQENAKKNLDDECEEIDKVLDMDMKDVYRIETLIKFPILAVDMCYLPDLNEYYFIVGNRVVKKSWYAKKKKFIFEYIYKPRKSTKKIQNSQGKLQINFSYSKNDDIEEVKNRV